MRIINKNNDGIMTTKKQVEVSDVESEVVFPMEHADKQPCWYVQIDNISSRDEALWRVGVKHTGGDSEYSFKVSDAGNIKSDKFWYRATSPDFAIGLLDKYKNGGKKAVKEWVSKGCPR